MANHTSLTGEAPVSSSGGDIDFSNPEIQEALEAVRTPNNDIRWVVLGYEGNSGRLKVVESGDGGLEDLADELSDGKINYAYWRAIDSLSPKFVYICWVGEGVPAVKKGLVNSHAHIVAQQVMKHFHVQINARNEDDLDEASVLSKVKTAGGADYDARGS